MGGLQSTSFPLLFPSHETEPLAHPRVRPTTVPEDRDAEEDDAVGPD